MTCFVLSGTKTLTHSTVIISTNVRCYYHGIYDNLVFQQDSALPLVHVAFNTVQLLQCKTQLPFF